MTSEHPKFAGSRLILTPYDPRHVPKYQNWFSSDPELCRLMATEPFNLGAAHAMQQEWSNDPKKAAFIVLHGGRINEEQQEIDAMIGDLSLVLSDDGDTCEVSLMIAEKGHRGKGFGGELLALAIDEVVPKMYPSAKALEAKIQKDNVASVTLFEKSGFIKTSFSEAFSEYTLVRHL